MDDHGFERGLLGQVVGWVLFEDEEISGAPSFKTSEIMLMMTPEWSSLSCQANGEATKTFLTRWAGGYMIRIYGFPVFEAGWTFSLLYDRLLVKSPDAEILEKMGEAKRNLTFLSSADSYLPATSKGIAANILAAMNVVLERADGVVTPVERGNFMIAFFQFNTILATDLAAFDLYWLQPALAYNTRTLIEDATRVFPEPIQRALSPKIKYEVQQAANCLLCDAPSAVGFHVLRGVELVVLDYFTIPGFERDGAATWSEYVRVLKKHNVHPKIRTMIARLAELHRNELMHAEAVLLPAEAAILFSLMQEVMPVMIADIAKRKGAPIADFPILDDPRWQN